MHFADRSGVESIKHMFVNGRHTAKIIIQVALHKFKVHEDATQYVLSELHEETNGILCLFFLSGGSLRLSVQQRNDSLTTRTSRWKDASVT